MGTSSSGSKSFLMASQMKNAPAIIIMMFPVSALAKPVYVRNSLKLLDMKSVNPIVVFFLRFWGYMVLRFCGYEVRSGCVVTFL